MHLNVRSLLNKIDEIRLLFKSNKAHIISFSETWLDCSISDSEIEIQNYTIIRKDRNRKGGGVCGYIRSDICFNVRTDLDNAHIEAVWLDILLPKTKPLLVGILYRPPTQSVFYDRLEETCSSAIDHGKRETILIGDWNTNMLKKDSSIYKAFSVFCNLFSLHQLISQCTRVSPTSQSIIDLVLTSDKSNISNSGAIDYGISDHAIIYCTRKTRRPVINCHHTVKIRSMRNYNNESLLHELGKLDLSRVLKMTSADEAWCYFKFMFLRAINQLAPVKSVRFKTRSEPWINAAIIEAITARNDSLQEYRKKKDEASFGLFKKLRNVVNRLIKKAKLEYYNDIIAENKDDPQKLWKSLKQLGYRNKLKTRTLNMNLNSEGTLTSDKSLVAGIFNNFFTTIASTLVNKLPSPSGRYGEDHVESFYKRLGVRTDDFHFNEVSEEVVLLKLRALKPSKATGIDNIPSRFIRDAAELISPFITHIINLSIKEGHVPHDFKQARVIPLHKKGSKLEPGNYRPVSILSSISKIMERVIFEQIDSYLASRELLFEFQSGFRKSHSTDTCLLFLTDHIRKEVDSGKYCGMVMLDLQKAFDTVNHDVLLCKLRALGFNSTSLSWVMSYLEGREQVVDINGTLSRPLPLKCGVPQGSILGPLFFLIYINDMQSACDCTLFLFADDSALLFSHKDKGEVERKLSSELHSVSIWLLDNKLSLHLGKTESILFASNSNLKKSPGFKIMVGDVAVSSKKEITYLGCILDNKLSGESMALKVISKVNQKTKFLARLSSFIDRSALVILANALIQCHFDYACSSWFTAITVKLKNRLQTSQNKLVRVILSLHPRTHLLPSHFLSLRWLRVEERVSQIKLCMVLRIFKREAPRYLTDYFCKVSDVHGYSTRGSSTNIVPIKFKSLMGKCTFLYSAAILWNRLPENIKLLTSRVTFKTSLKKWLQNGS